MSYFTEDELRCKCGCGVYKFDEGALRALNAIREECGFPFFITSGYRCPNHPLERGKSKAGAHQEGTAVDINVVGEQAFEVIDTALAMGCKRIGIMQKGDYKNRFIHLDWSKTLPSPAVWSY